MLFETKPTASSPGQISRHTRSGFICVLAAIMMVFLLAMVAFAVDIGYLCVVKTQTQAVADAAALAGARGLATSTAQVQANAIACAKLNTANGKVVNLVNSNIVVGTWNPTTLTFTAASGSSTNNAVQVTVPLTASNGNPVSLFFARALGDTSANVSSTSIAGGGRWDVVIAIDRTSSFQDDLSTAVSGIQNVLTAMNTYSPQSYLGVTTFNGKSYTNAAMQQVGTNYSTLQADIAAIQDCAFGGPACSGSDLAAGMAGGIALFSSSGYSPPSGTRKAIIFVSDGAANVTSQCVNSMLNDTQDNALAASEAAAAYSSKGISVFSLLYYHGSDNSTDINAMKALIQGQGTYIQEADPSLLAGDLQSIYTNNLGMQLLQ
jgi:Flp pilus assembly protein TadG